MTKSRVNVKCPECEHIFLPSKDEIQSRAGAASRRKGSQFENKVAREIQKWWNTYVIPLDKPYEFKRTPSSGGSALKTGFDMAGDICTNAPDFPYHLELKNAPSMFTGLHNIFSDKSKLIQWFIQADKDCPKNKIPLLIFNRFDMPTFVGHKTNSSNRLEIYNILVKARFDFITFVNYGMSGEYYIWLYKDMLLTTADYWRKNKDGT